MHSLWSKGSLLNVSVAIYLSIYLFENRVKTTIYLFPIFFFLGCAQKNQTLLLKIFIYM
ncbi:hypothetical protein BDA99DRAFT_512481, partial [Phascolomyces articulosus]